MRKLMLAAAVVAAASLLGGGLVGAGQPRPGALVPVTWHCPDDQVPLQVIDYSARGFPGAASAAVQVAVAAGRCWGDRHAPVRVELVALVYAEPLRVGWAEAWEARLPAGGAGDGARVYVLLVTRPAPETGPAPFPSSMDRPRAGPGLETELAPSPHPVETPRAGPAPTVPS